MPALLAALDAFLQEHRRCGDLDGGVSVGPRLLDQFTQNPAPVRSRRSRVWLSTPAGASRAHAVRTEARGALVVSPGFEALCSRAPAYWTKVHLGSGIQPARVQATK